MFPIHFSYQNSQFSIVIVVNVFSWIDFKIYMWFFLILYIIAGIAEILFESGVKHHNHRNKISKYFPWNIIIPLCHLFTCVNTISDNPAAASLPPFTYMPLRRGVLDTTLCDKVCRWLAAGSWFSSGTLVSSSNKSDLHDITEIVLKVAFNTHNLNPCLFDIPE